GQNIGSAIIQPLDNISDSEQLVQYVITPWTVNASDENECTDAGEVITIDIWINPTPRVITTILRDTICNDTRTHITLNTPTILTNGFVTFDYTSLADPGLTGDFGNSNRVDGYIIEDLLNNATALPAYPLVVRYSITPLAGLTGCADGPIITDSITVHPTADTYMSADSVICYLESNGTASVIAENGVNLFSYEWDDPLSQTDSLATGLPIGNYTVTITDNQSCMKIDSIIVEQPYRLIPVIDTVRSVSCFGIGDAYIILDPTGGNATYSYIWSNGESTDSIGGLNGGNYYVTVTDWKGCAQDTLVAVSEPPPASIEISPHHVTCNGENDGSAEISVVGLDLYSWTTGETTAIINNLSPGSYTVTAYNAEGCSNIESTTIYEPEILQIDTIISNRISCAGDADGTLDLIVSGGNNVDFFTDPFSPLPYIYSWSTPDGTGLITNIEDQTGLSGGKYYITVSDWQGCLAIDSTNVFEPPTYFDSITTSNILCNGDNNGTIDLYVEGGNTETPYTYLWSTSNGDGLITDVEDQANLYEGDYYVTITDYKGCELYDTAIITEPDLIEANLNETNSTCFGYEDGTIMIEIVGGTGLYDIEWSTGEIVDSIFGLSANTYYVTITDDNNCSTTNSVEITEPEQIISNMSSTNITCFGFNNGEISLNPTGGTSPYNYIWSHDAGLNTNIATNLQPNDYTIDILDANNCIETSNITLTEPDKMIATIDKNDVTCFGFNDGHIGISIFGGTTPLSYYWSNDFDDSVQDFMSPGVYDITIIDQLDCIIDTTLEIIEPEELMITPVLRKPTCPDISDGFIELNIIGGRTPYTVYWDNGSADLNLYDVRSGIYKVLITDSSFCEIASTFTLHSAFESCLEIPSAFSPNDDNINDKWVINLNELYPQAEIEIFDRSGKRIFYSKGYEESQYWDGSLNGKKLPMDAYYYIIYLKNGAERISGIITLLR
nr:gliding motility-associated C-terminal domain-containing protein [Bacteroidales bacterium]